MAAGFRVISLTLLIGTAIVLRGPGVELLEEQRRRTDRRSTQGDLSVIQPRRLMPWMLDARWMYAQRKQRSAQRRRSDLGLRTGAGDGNRTRVLSLGSDY